MSDLSKIWARPGKPEPISEHAARMLHAVSVGLFNRPIERKDKS